MLDITGAHWALNIEILRIPLLSILAIGFVILLLIFLSGGSKNNKNKNGGEKS
ncbi:MAG: hypothetical protein UV48_C0016G0012 [Candidatus Azambacteria bacterium GW2011_GWA2_42_9]|uniref:Uncharacterized protein n=1 Tax=Candidatus Azambacteria bacterium GW2011_GWA2_42_9 TaxID=1618613 RepID=A0A0G1DWR9_9BACT|nr:MAG: hypothetical protein UV48_C0016G0012 [Candidatus Azambacteria bacterium GW2011_GWA2_42_9]